MILDETALSRDSHDIRTGGPAFVADGPTGRVKDSRHEGPNMTLRRVLFAALVLSTMTLLVLAMISVMRIGGLTPIETAMIVLFALNTPWVSIGFWNAVIGFLVLNHSRDWLRTILPVAGLHDDTRPIRSRTAIVMPAYNEDPDRVFRHLRSILDSLDETGESDAFEIFMLSDTRKVDLAAREQALFDAWQASDRAPDRIHYRRREVNSRRKVGNIADFCERWGDRFEHMIVLDADSVMSGEAILRMVRLMEANPKIGILQTLVTGLPASSPFARIFQFGMRHGMRSYTVGSAWWQGDEGPYWGHNAILRLDAFRAHCGLPTLPGEAPLGGEILSHDQVESVLMRRGGFEVRVLPIEDGSYEQNPTTLPDFLSRDLRWCQGNMQYTGLLGMPGLFPLGRLQLLLAIKMYLASLFWYGFMALGIIQITVNALSYTDAEVALMAEASLFSNPATMYQAIGLFAVMMTLTMAPKLMGVFDVLVSPAKRRAYGGTLRVLASTVLELLFSFLLGPVMALSQCIFIVGLYFGRMVHWEAQARDDRAVGFADAFFGLWPQTLTGVAATALLWSLAPTVLLWALPVLLGLSLAAPVTVLTSHPGLGRWLTKAGLCVIPEEMAPSAQLRALGYRPSPIRAARISSSMRRSRAALPKLDRAV